MLNSIMLIGRVGKDAELRYVPSGKATASFNMAVDDGYGDHKHTIWYKCTLWEKRAESLAQYLTKGQVVYVEGSLQSTDAGECRTWTDKDGKVHASFEVTVRELKLLPGGPKRDQENEPAQAPVQDKVPF